MFADHITKLNTDIQAGLDALATAHATFNTSMQKAHADFVSAVQTDMTAIQDSITALEQQIVSVLQIVQPAPTPPVPTPPA